jgi:hypothetical protein
MKQEMLAESSYLTLIFEDGKFVEAEVVLEGHRNSRGKKLSEEEYGFLKGWVLMLIAGDISYDKGKKFDRGLVEDFLELESFARSLTPKRQQDLRLSGGHLCAVIRGDKEPSDELLKGMSKK